MAGMRQNSKDVAEVLSKYPPGSRLRCVRNDKTYQMGVKSGASGFWLLCEQDSKKGVVSAADIMVNFVRCEG